MESVNFTLVTKPSKLNLMEKEIDDLIDFNCYMDSVPVMAKPLLKNAKWMLAKIEKMLYQSPAFLRTVRAAVPRDMYVAIFTDEQKQQLAEGTLKLMNKKDGSIMANLVNPETKKIVKTVPLEKIQMTPELSMALDSFSMQMQMAQIAESIKEVQIAIEEVQKGQEYDRLATAYSCQQKFLQAMRIKDPSMKQMALLKLAQDSEDSRNLLMQSQKAGVKFIQNQPEDTIGKILTKTSVEKIDAKFEEVRENLAAVNMVSLVEALAYNELGEEEAAYQSLEFHSQFMNSTYLDKPQLLERLDQLDPSPINYWTVELPKIDKKIKHLPYNEENKRIEG